MKISVIGSGYVGLVSGACLAEVGHQILCLDLDDGKIQKLQNGIIPIYEPGLEVMIRKNLANGRISFTTSVEASVKFSNVQMIAVGTPSMPDGGADLQFVENVASDIGRFMTENKIVINKSTVPVGTGALVEGIITAELVKRDRDLTVSIVSNPEFLKEGAAIEDFMKPDRIIIGVENSETEAVMRAIYEPFQRNHDRIIFMDVRSSELTKYAANAMLATRISFMNELAKFAELSGADIEHVRKGIGSDPRIGNQFLYPGIGYGGSCFPKDVAALIQMAQVSGLELNLLKSVSDTNSLQRKYFLNKILERLGESLEGVKFAVWGLSFKPNTNDIRYSPGIEIVRSLLERGAEIYAYDPVANIEAEEELGAHANLKFTANSHDALCGVNALLVNTEWLEFRSLPYQALEERMQGRVIFDGRNIYNPDEVRRSGFEYFGIGRQ